MARNSASAQQTKLSATQHESYKAYTLICLLLPLVGIILGIVYLTKDKPLDKKFGEHLLTVSILFIILWGALFTTFQIASQNKTDSTTSTQSASLQAAAEELSTAANDSERQTDINALDSHIEANYAINGWYPSLAELNDSNWRNTNMSGLAPEAFVDPGASSSSLASKPGTGIYAYQATPATCDNAKVKCTGFTLTATLSSGESYSKSSF